MSKDNFSTQANIYAKFRPQYPAELFDYLFTKVKSFNNALDVATGNGQAAKVLAQKFNIVEATDISERQIINATKMPNIHYSVQNAEKSTFRNHSFDLITVAQALHWFNFDLFFAEVERLIKKDGVFATWCYGLNKVNNEIDDLVLHFYQNVIGSYWDSERQHIENKYATIPFPWGMESTDFTYKIQYSAEDYLGYLNTWSSVQHYIKQNHVNPVSLIEKELKALWGKNLLEVTFPIHMKLVCL